MKKSIRRMMICAVFAVLCWGFFLIKDKMSLSKGLIRFHVVANSNSQEDQRIKLTVRDAVLSSIQADLQAISDIDNAKEYLQDSIPKIQILVEQTLMELGYHGPSTVSFCKEQFDVRHYDTFSLPAGVYDSLRIVIGEGLGRNWWCVSFPTLCLPATVSEFQDVAVGAGFSDSLVRTLSGDEAYEIRFFFLDQLGKLENILLGK